MQNTKSFAETAIVEAVTRRARIDLVLKPVTPGTDTRLISRFLGLRGDDVVLEVPRTRTGGKVFVPEGWTLGIAFEQEGLWLQARGVVTGHCLFGQHGRSRADALVIQRTGMILAFNRRRKSRDGLDPGKPIVATVWATARIESGEPAPAQVGRLTNWSESGMGIRLPGPLCAGAGAEVIIRLHVGKADEYPIFRGIVKHCTEDAPDSWILGLGDVLDVGPGEAVSWMEVLAAAHGQDHPRDDTTASGHP